MNILIAEDEVDLRNLLSDNLSREGYQVYTASDGETALQLFLDNQIDVGIFDVMMPKMDGFKLVQKVRETSQMPVIFLTARSEEMDRILGLSLGADDYLVKPFSMAELKMRVQIQIRHLHKESKLKKNANVLTCDGIVLNMDEVTCYKNQIPIELGAKEFLLLKFLMEEQGRVYTKKQIYNAVWEDEYLYDDNTIMVHLSRLRSKIEDDPKNPTFIITVRGIGYKFKGSL